MTDKGKDMHKTNTESRVLNVFNHGHLMPVPKSMTVVKSPGVNSRPIVPRMAVGFRARDIPVYNSEIPII